MLHVEGRVRASDDGVQYVRESSFLRQNDDRIPKLCENFQVLLMLYPFPYDLITVPAMTAVR
jgi:hypothetical protein